MSKVLVAMSGGIDSSVAAALLKEEGHKIIGATMVVHDAFSEIDNAKIIAERLNIPLKIFDLRDVFTRKVIKSFIGEYSQARTPNPCVICNREIKFGVLLNKALALDCDNIATGHYARIEKNSSGSERYLLKKGKDGKKDQSYMLYRLLQYQLKHILFPLGEYTKERVKKIAEERKLIIDKREESQEICFIPDNDYVAYLNEKNPGISRPGPIIDKEGKLLGQHKGLHRYTIGQRRGLGISLPYPVYVIKLDKDRNAVVVGKDEEVFKDKCIVQDVNWIAIDKLLSACEVMVKIRYNTPARRARIFPVDNSQVKIVFAEKQRAVTPGQSAVFYKGDTVIGGGIIM